MAYKIIFTLSMLIMFLSIIGGIISGIWLLILGKYSLVGISLLMLLISPWILSVLMLPTLLLVWPLTYFHEKKFLRYLFTFISQIYINTLIFVIYIFAFLVYFNLSDEKIGINSMPYLLWAWSIVSGSWLSFTSREANTDSHLPHWITFFSASTLSSLLLISAFIDFNIMIVMFIIFGIIQLIIIPILNTRITGKLSKEEITSIPFFKKKEPTTPNIEKLKESAALTEMGASLGKIKTFNRKDRAIEALEEAITINPANISAHITLAMVYRDKGMITKALTILYEIENKSDTVTNFSLFSTFATIYIHQNNKTNAIKYAQKAIDAYENPTRNKIMNHQQNNTSLSPDKNADIQILKFLKEFLKDCKL